ncbi:MAG: cell division ATP-binding protein FtsE [Rhodospirillales bacterium]
MDGTRDTVEGGGVAVRFEDVAVAYPGGPAVVDKVSFVLADGAFRVLIGPSGAGKTTVLRLMYLALRPTAGRITLFGDDLAAVPRARRPALRRQIGVVFQDFRLLDHLSVLDNVALPLRIAGRDEEDVLETVTAVLNWIGLDKQRDALPRALSGGQQQLVAIARAVVGRPRLLLGDEPTGNVDDRIAARLTHLFEELNRGGTTVVLATHNHALADRIGRPRLWMERGTLRSTPPSTAVEGIA